MIVALEQLACQFICLLFCDQLSHTNFLGFCNPSSIFVGIESTYGDDPSEFVKNKEHTDFRESSKARYIFRIVLTVIAQYLKIQEFFFFSCGGGTGENGLLKLCLSPSNVCCSAVTLRFHGSKIFIKIILVVNHRDSFRTLSITPTILQLKSTFLKRLNIYNIQKVQELECTG